MHFRGFNSLEEVFYSHLLPGTVALLTLFLFVGLFRGNLIRIILQSNLNDFLVALLGFLIAIILGNVVDAFRHYYFDRIQREYGQYHDMWPVSLRQKGSTRVSAISQDPLCTIVGIRGSVTEKMQLREWLRFNQYYLGELLGNLALVTPFLVGVLSFYLRLHLTIPVYWAITIFVLGVLLSWFMFKVSSIYISNFENNVRRLTGR